MLTRILFVFRAWLVPVVLAACAMPALAMEELDNGVLSNVVGQSLLNANTATDTVSGVTTTYYRLGLDAELDLNMNINEFKLGCDGAGGTGTCDIDLSRVRMTGIGATNAADSGPAKDFILRRPYLEFAIEQAGSAANRRVVGVRMGALEALGVMAIGENPNTTDINDDYGIGRLTGFMVANVNATMTDVNATPCAVSLWLLCGLTATVTNHVQALELNRATTADLTGMSAVAIGLTLKNSNMLGVPLDNIHQITVANDAAGTTPTKDFYISFQQKDVYWQRISTGGFHDTVATTNQGNTVYVAIPAAHKGWSIFMPNVQLQVNTSNTVNVPIGDVLGGVFGSSVSIAPVDLQSKPADNCWGTLTFC